MQARMEAVKAQVEAALDAAMSDLPSGDLADAMRYACVGGKKLRAFLVMESARLHDVADEAALPVAAAVEAGRPPCVCCGVRRWRCSMAPEAMAAICAADGAAWPGASLMA